MASARTFRTIKPSAETLGRQYLQLKEQQLRSLSDIALLCLTLAEQLAAVVPVDQLTDDDRAQVARLPKIRARLAEMLQATPSQEH
jgi:hypothetical protein